MMDINEAISIVKKLVELNKDKLYMDEIRAFNMVIDAAENYNIMDKEKVIASFPIKGRIKEEILFDLIDKYIDEHYDEIFEIINQRLLSHCITSATLFPYGDKDIIRSIKFSIDKDEHMWYNTFNKWNWTKFENGVIKIDERRI